MVTLRLTNMEVEHGPLDDDVTNTIQDGVIYEAVCKNLMSHVSFLPHPFLPQQGPVDTGPAV